MSGNTLGIVAATLSGIVPILLRPRRGLVPSKDSGLPELQAQAVVEEQHSDELTMTDHPVEVGTVITDHAFRMPSELTITYGWTASSFAGLAPPSQGSDQKFLRDVYDRLREFQANRILLDVYTGKRLYNNMLLRTVRLRTTKDTENALIVEATLREVLIARTQEAVVGDAANHTNPEATSPVQARGAKALQGDAKFNATDEVAP